MGPNAYQVMLDNMLGSFGTFLLGRPEASYNAIDWTHSMYLFTPPLIVYGVYRLWRDRRELARWDENRPLADGGLLVLIWLLATLFNGSVIGGVINHNNAIFYPVILIVAYVLWRMGKRLRVALLTALCVYTVSFACLCNTYFADEKYQTQAAFLNGLHEALVDTWGWDYDHYYLTSGGDEHRLMNAQVMFAHKIDYSALSEATDLIGPDGEPSGWYFTERYIFTDFSDFEPDPYDCAVYIVEQREKALFDAEDYLIYDYGQFAAVYPRYWAE